MAQAERRQQQSAEEAADERAAFQPDEAEDEEAGARYPLDPGAAYSSEPEPADQSFAEHEHWVRRRDRR